MAEEQQPDLLEQWWQKLRASAITESALEDVFVRAMAVALLPNGCAVIVCPDRVTAEGLFDRARALLDNVYAIGSSPAQVLERLRFVVVADMKEEARA